MLDISELNTIEAILEDGKELRIEFGKNIKLGLLSRITMTNPVVRVRLDGDIIDYILFSIYTYYTTINNILLYSTFVKFNI